MALTIHEQNNQNLAVEMLKALNDLSTADLSELFQLNESLYPSQKSKPRSNRESTKKNN